MTNAVVDAFYRYDDIVPDETDRFHDIEDHSKHRKRYGLFKIQLILAFIIVLSVYEIKNFTNPFLTVQRQGGVCNSTKQYELLSKHEQVNGELTQELQFLKKSLEEENRNWNRKIKDLTTEFETLQQNYTTLKQVLHSLEYNARVYRVHLNFISNIEKRIREMEVCFLYLENYSKLKKKGYLHAVNEIKEMDELAKYLDCEKDIPADYYIRISKSFQHLIKNMLEFRTHLVNLAITGDFKKMEAEQQRSTSALDETCHFICNLEETQSAETVFEKGWVMLMSFLT